MSCPLCMRELDRKISDSAYLVCEQGHTTWVHQRCFDKHVDKAIRVRSTRSTSFENIARSPNHSWKTQKCALPDCIKWLADYREEPAPEKPAVTVHDKQEASKIVFKSKLSSTTHLEEDGDEDENSTQCTATKVDGTRCNFTISDHTYNLCRRCSEKAAKQRELVEGMNSNSNGSDEDVDSKLTESPKKTKMEKDKEKKKNNKVNKGQGLNSMLKSLAKPSTTPQKKPPKDSSVGQSSQLHSSAPPGIFSSGSTGTLSNSSSSNSLASLSLSDQCSSLAIPDVVSNEAQLLHAIRYFIGNHGEGGRTTPREIARYLGTLPGGGKGTTAIEVMRARFHKLRNLLEAFPKMFTLHEVIHPPGSEGGAEYEVSLVVELQHSLAQPSREASPATPQLQNLVEDEMDSDNGVDILSLLGPPMKPEARLPESVDAVLNLLGLGQYGNIFRNHEFLPNDLFLATDDDLKEIGIPDGPRLKLRNWVNSQISAA